MIIRVDKQKKNLFATRQVYWISTKPEGWMVCRRRSDFDWLAQAIGLSNNADVRDKEDVEQMIAMLNSDQALFALPFVQFFLSCLNSKLFYQRKKKEFKGGKQEAVAGGKDSQILNDFVQELDGRAKTLKNLMKDVRHISEDVCFIVDQLGIKLKRLGEAFNKLGECWTPLEKFDLANVTRHPAAESSSQLSQLFASLKLDIFQWSNTVENQKKQLAKNFGSQADTVIANCKDLRKNLKIRREADESQAVVANEIVLAQFTKCLISFSKACTSWIDVIGKVAPQQEGMTTILKLNQQRKVS